MRNHPDKQKTTLQEIERMVFVLQIRFSIPMCWSHKLLPKRISLIIRFFFFQGNNIRPAPSRSKSNRHPLNTLSTAWPRPIRASVKIEHISNKRYHIKEYFQAYHLLSFSCWYKGKRIVPLKKEPAENNSFSDGYVVFLSSALLFFKKQTLHESHCNQRWNDVYDGNCH